MPKSSTYTTQEDNKERKWGASGDNKFFGTIRALAFYLFTVAVACPLFVVMLALFPFVWLFDKKKRLAEHIVNDIWANISMFPFFRVWKSGTKNLPPNDVPAVYVANHSSYLDIFSLFALYKPFKFISKTSNFLIPIVGWSMFLTGHIGLKRTDRRSQMQVLGTCVEMLKSGASLLFFPEGTRSEDGRMAEWKKGAFSVAVKAGAPIVPVTLLGTGALMANGGEGRLNGGAIGIVVHPPIPTVGADGKPADPQEVMEASRAAVASALPAGTF